MKVFGYHIANTKLLNIVMSFTKKKKKKIVISDTVTKYLTMIKV